MTNEECEAAWPLEALARASKEADESTFEGPEREAYIRERKKHHYDELEKLPHNPHAPC